MQTLSNSQRLKHLRETLKFSQREMGREFQVTGAAIAQWENGRREIFGPVLKLIEVYEEVTCSPKVEPKSMIN